MNSKVQRLVTSTAVMAVLATTSACSDKSKPSARKAPSSTSTTLSPEAESELPFTNAAKKLCVVKNPVGDTDTIAVAGPLVIDPSQELPFSVEVGWINETTDKLKVETRVPITISEDDHALAEQLAFTKDDKQVFAVFSDDTDVPELQYALIKSGRDGKVYATSTTPSVISRYAKNSQADAGDLVWFHDACIKVSEEAGARVRTSASQSVALSPLS